MPSFSDWPEGPLDAAQRAFDLLVMPPAPLGFDGRQIPDCPQRLMPLDELKRWLLRRGTPAQVRDAVWRQLVTHARRDGPVWVVAAVGVAMPGLRAMAGKLAAGYAGDTDDLDAELLVGFVRKLREVDLDEPKVLLRLLWAAERAGRKVRYAQVSSDPLEFEPAGPRTPLPPWGHPDLVLASAVRAAVIDTDEAAMIAATRLEDLASSSAAREFVRASFRRSLELGRVRIRQILTRGTVSSCPAVVGAAPTVPPTTEPARDRNSVLGLPLCGDSQPTRR